MRRVVMKPYRNSTEVIEVVLDATQEKGREGIRVTTLMNRSNLQHTRLKKLLGKLVGNDLIVEFKVKDRQTYVITEKGIQYLEQYRKFSDLAGSFGLEV